MRVHKPEVCASLESRMNKVHADLAVKKMPFMESHRVKANGFSGCIWILLNKANTNMDIFADHKQFIHCKINNSMYLTIM